MNIRVFKCRLYFAKFKGSSLPTALSLSGDDVTDLDLVDSVYPSP